MSSRDIDIVSETLPIKTFQELMQWTPMDNSDSLQQPLSLVVHERHNEQNRVLFCHDMKGGYLADRFDAGSDQSWSYRFWHWSLIDTFVYFSHHLVTIPPKQWISSSHLNGVTVLGTFIVEGWTEEAKHLEHVLQEKTRAEHVARQLAAIARVHRFDGWLINIEAAVRPELVANLVHLVHVLTQEMRACSDHSSVIWYDSVTLEGALDWQNELNNKNLDFFAVCDAIFLNYTWTEEHLTLSRQVAARLDRTPDVFVGVDVFGRGCFSGGGFNTREAVKLVQRVGLSLALFGTAWTHEVLGETDFTRNEYRFWRQLKLPVGHWPTRLPLVSSFCQGFGVRKAQRGFTQSDSPWHNLALQHVQPSFQEKARVEIGDALDGGTCLRLTGSRVPVFRCNVVLTQTPPLLVGVVYKSRRGQRVSVVLRLNGQSVRLDEKREIEKTRDLCLDKWGLRGVADIWKCDVFLVAEEAVLSAVDIEVDASEEEVDVLLGRVVLTECHCVS